MTAKPTMTLAEATSERDRLAAEARAAGEVADRLAEERRTVLDARRRAWATTVLADHAERSAVLRTAEQAAARVFREAAVAGDPRPAYLAWMTARAALNVQHDRVVQARAALGEDQTETTYPSTDWPTYSLELDRALSSEASSRFADLMDALQHELNALDEA